MANPEIVSLETQPIMSQSVVFLPEQPVWSEVPVQGPPIHRDINVSHEEVDRFLAEMTLDTSDLDIELNSVASGTIIFMQQAVIRVRHPDAIVSANSYSLTERNIEVIRGKKLVTSEHFVPTANKDGFTTFAPLEKLVSGGELNDYTADIIRRTRANGRYHSEVTRQLWPLISPGEQ